MHASTIAIARKGLAILFLCGAATLTSLPLTLHGLGYTQRIEAEVRPADSTPANLVLTIRLSAFHGAAIDGNRLPEGLGLVAESDRPYVDDAGIQGSEMVLELRSATEGRVWVDKLRVKGGGGAFDLAPFELVFPERPGEIPARTAWTWRAPSRVWQYQSFGIRLEPLDGRQPATSAWPTFDVPTGILLEEGNDTFSWVATALVAGSIVLPEVTIEGPDRGHSPIRTLVVEKLPTAIEASRAIGDFTIALEAPPEATRGSPLTIKLTLSGEGNFPALRPPPMAMSLDGRNLAVTERLDHRVDSFAKTGKDYKGSLIIETSLVPQSTGRLSVSTQPWLYLSESGQTRSLGAEVRSIHIISPEGAAMSDATSTAMAILAGQKGRPAREALERLKAGNTAGALALYYHAARFAMAYRQSAFRLAASLDLPAPDLGLPLAPLPFLIGGALSLICGGFIFFSPLRFRKAPRSRTNIRAMGIACLAIAVLALISAALVGVNRGEERWLSYSTSMASTPSIDSERSIALPLGRTGRKIGLSGAWICLEFSDGSAGWLPLSSVYSY